MYVPEQVGGVVVSQSALSLAISDSVKPKNPHAVALSMLGASKGGLARAAKLTPDQRIMIARAAVQARWAKRQNGDDIRSDTPSGSVAVSAVANPTVHKPIRKSLRGSAKRSTARSRALEQRVWELLSSGKTPTAIALEVGIARPSVHRLIRRVERRYRAVLMVTAVEMKFRQVRALEAQIDKALAAFERSKQPGQRVSRTTGNGTELVESQVESQAGDWRFLAAAREAMGEIRKIYGIGVPYETPEQAQQAIAALSAPRAAQGQNRCAAELIARSADGG
jgi:DNA-binding CsgD family transcriptional regulator